MPTDMSPRERRWRSKQCNAGPNTSRRRATAGPGGACPREDGLSTADGIDYSSAEGVLGDADRDQIDTMVLYPSLGLCAPSLEDPQFAAGVARPYNARNPGSSL